MSRTHSILRRSTATTDNPPFVPSPQWLSDSPARPATSGHGTPAMPSPDRIGQPTPRVSSMPLSPQAQEPRAFLRSPIPPPPPNLYQGGTSAFNVDPGVPFLATAGSHSEEGSDGGSFPVSPTPKQKLANGIVGGLKRAVGSLKKTTTSRSHSVKEPGTPYPPPPHGQLRDSGYGEPSQNLTNGVYYPDTQSVDPYIPGESEVYIIPRSPDTPAYNEPDAEYIPSGTPSQGHGYPVYPDQDYTDPQYYSPVSARSFHVQTPGQLMPPTGHFSPISATPDYGPDYAQMEETTPPPSEISFNTYLWRLQRFVGNVASLPWVNSDRPTVDYYPERSKRRDEPKHAPKIVWRAADYARPSFKISKVAVIAEEGSEAGTWDSYDDFRHEREEVKVPVIAIIPHKGSQVDLGEEFGEPPPVSAVQTTYTPRWKEQSLYEPVTPARTASVKLPMSRPATPNQPLQSLPQDSVLTPIAHPQPRYSAGKPFQPPPLSQTNPPTPRAASRASSRGNGYALYDPPLKQKGRASPASARSSRRSMSDYQPSSVRAASIRTAPDEYTRHPISQRRSQSGHTYASPSPRGPPRSSSRSGSGSGPRPDWEDYVVRRTGYVPYNEAPRQAPYSHGSAGSRSGANTPRVVTPVIAHLRTESAGDSKTPSIASLPYI